MGESRSEAATVVVTGAAGLVGLPLLRCLREQGYRVVAVDDGSAGTLSRLTEFAGDTGVVVEPIDVRNRHALLGLIETHRPWAVVHLAARHFIPDCERDPATALAVNVLGTQHVIDACVVQPPQRLLVASTADVYKPADHPHHEDDPLGPHGVYGNSKLLGERLLRDQVHRLRGCDVLIPRLFNVYGCGDPHAHLLPEIVHQARRSNWLDVGELTEARDFVYVEDIADALATLLRTGATGVVNIGTGIAFTGQEVVALVGELTGQRLRVHRDPRRLRRNPRPVSHAETHRLRALVPWWPRTPLREGIRHLLTAAPHGELAANTWRAS